MTMLGYRWYCVRHWFRELPERACWKLAWLLPRRIALLAFIRVYSATGAGPGPEYSNTYDAWERGAGK